METYLKLIIYYYKCCSSYWNNKNIYNSIVQDHSHLFTLRSLIYLAAPSPYNSSNCLSTSLFSRIGTRKLHFRMKILNSSGGHQKSSIRDKNFAKSFRGRCPRSTIWNSPKFRNQALNGFCDKLRYQFDYPGWYFDRSCWSEVTVRINVTVSQKEVIWLGDSNFDSFLGVDPRSVPVVACVYAK